MQMLIPVMLPFCHLHIVPSVGNLRSIFSIRSPFSACPKVKTPKSTKMQLFEYSLKKVDRLYNDPKNWQADLRLPAALDAVELSHRAHPAPSAFPPKSHAALLPGGCHAGFRIAPHGVATWCHVSQGQQVTMWQPALLWSYPGFSICPYSGHFYKQDAGLV